MREQAGFCESCNVIGSGSGQNFLSCLPTGQNPSPGWVSLTDGRLHTEVSVLKKDFY